MEYRLNIKELRLNKNILQTELAKTVGISRSFLSEIEKGKYDIKLSLLLSIADALEVNEKELYTKKE